MKFPDYVPVAVREYVSDLLEHSKLFGEPLREDDAARLDRLIRYPEMKEIYGKLTLVASDRIKEVFHAAFMLPGIDTKRLREERDRANELYRDISKHAAILAKKLEMINDIGQHFATPVEFYSLPHLIHRSNPRNTVPSWQAWVSLLIPNPDTQRTGEAAGESQPGLSYLPDAEALVRRLAEAADEASTRPREIYRLDIAQAISSQKDNSTADLVRMLNAWFVDDGINLGRHRNSIIAGLVTVAMNLDGGISAENVGKFIKRKIIKRKIIKCKN